MKYRAEVDGLRAIAVVPVILFHAGFDAFSGGYVGVDVFFVISGYLITTILLEELAESRFSLAGFYERRARRILPPLYLVCVCTLVFGWIFMSPIELKKLGESVMGVASVSANFVFWLDQGYFDELSDLNPLMHTWSLAVEEQFYLFFPVLLGLIYRFNSKSILGIVIFLATMSFLLSVWAVNIQASNRVLSGAFFLLPTRAWELGVGSLVAIIIVKRSSRTSNKASKYIFEIYGLFSIFFAILYFDKSTVFPGLAAVIPVSGTALFLYGSSSSSGLGKLLGSRFFVGIGLISYSLYLWHQPVFAGYRIYSNNMFLSNWEFLGLVFLSVFLATASWYLIERPCRRIKNMTRLSILMLAFVLSLSIGLLGFITKSVTSDYEYDLAKQLSVADNVYFGNVDERKFTEGRLIYPLKEAGILIMGSSRVMQLGTDITEMSAINVAVSGASLPDYIVLLPEALLKVEASKVILGADPWLFNRSNNKNARIANLETYTYWSNLLSRQQEMEEEWDNPGLEEEVGWATNGVFEQLYNYINRSSLLVPENSEPESKIKKNYDGTIQYDLRYTDMSKTEIESGFDSILDYRMIDYEEDIEAKNSYINLILWLQTKGVTVSILLTPYHPKVFNKMQSEKSIFIDIEKTFQKIGAELNVEVQGSYNPEIVGCNATEFYDGMHPKRECMAKIFAK